MKKNYFLGSTENGFHRVVYAEWGEAKEGAVPIICVHGQTRNSHDFDNLGHFLSEKGYHLYCPDIVGRGDSDRLKNPIHYNYDQYAADMTALIARTGSSEVDWVGTSMGGLLGMFLASLSNSPIRRLIINDIGPQIPIKGITRLLTYAPHKETFDSLETAKIYYKNACAEFGPLTDEQWMRIAKNSVREISPGKFLPNFDPKIQLLPSKGKLILQMIRHPMRILQGTLFDVDLWQIWRKITCPVLLIHGKKSDILTDEIIEKMHKTHNSLEVLVVPDAGHAPLLLNTRELEQIYQWLLKS